MAAGLSFFVLDLETSGLQWKNNFHEIHEFSIIRAADRTQLNRNVRVNNPQNSSFDALRICGKTMADLNKGISKKELIDIAEQFILEDGLTSEHRCLVGHNIINFDRKFLWQLWETFNKQFPFSLYLDTMHLMRKYAKLNQIVKPALNLGASCDLLGIKKYAKSHTAKDDTKNTFLLWQELMDKVDYLDCIKRMPHNIDE